MGLFSSNKLKKKQKAYEAKRREAMEAQRKGDIQAFSRINDEAEQLLREMQATGQKG